MASEMAILGSSVGALTTAQRVLANDVANANTPRFRSQAVRFHVLVSGRIEPTVVSEPGVATANGNGVDLEATLLQLEKTTAALQGVDTLIGMGITADASVVNNLQGA